MTAVWSVAAVLLVTAIGVVTTVIFGQASAIAGLAATAVFSQWAIVGGLTKLAALRGGAS